MAAVANAHPDGLVGDGRVLTLDGRVLHEGKAITGLPQPRANVGYHFSHLQQAPHSDVMIYRTYVLLTKKHCVKSDAHNNTDFIIAPIKLSGHLSLNVSFLSQ